MFWKKNINLVNDSYNFAAQDKMFVSYSMKREDPDQKILCRGQKLSWEVISWYARNVWVYEALYSAWESDI